MAFNNKQLAQARPSGTSAVSVYSPPANTRTVIRSIFVANTTGSAATYRIFIDDNGTTYDESTALFWDVSLPAGSTDLIGGEPNDLISMEKTSGNLAVRTDTGSALTFTIYGSEY